MMDISSYRTAGHVHPYTTWRYYTNKTDRRIDMAQSKGNRTVKRGRAVNAGLERVGKFVR